MMTMLPEAEFPQFVAMRQQDLRAAVAATRPLGPQPSSRQRLGRVLVRLGRWVEGRRPELTREPVPAPPRLARSH